jgi:uncharacterized protein (TIGR02246 family)
MKRVLWLLPTLALALTACGGGSAPAQGTAEDETVLRGMADKYSAAFNAADIAALGQMVTEDFENISADGTHTQGRAAFQQREEAALKERQTAGLKVTLNTTTGYLRWIDATRAVVGGTYTMSGLPAGASDKGSWMVVDEKGTDGQWRIRHALVAANMPPPPAQMTDSTGK